MAEQTRYDLWRRNDGRRGQHEHATEPPVNEAFPEGPTFPEAFDEKRRHNGKNTKKLREKIARIYPPRQLPDVLRHVK